MKYSSRYFVGLMGDEILVEKITGVEENGVDEENDFVVTKIYLIIAL